MFWIQIVVLFLISLLGGAIAFIRKGKTPLPINYLLSFSAAFLLGVSFLHFIPDIFQNFGYHSGLWIMVGFFGQQFIQRFTHGVEHGHSHIHEHSKQAIFSVFIGLSFHAFTEGIPLIDVFGKEDYHPTMALAIGLHKIPETLLITSMVKMAYPKSNFAYLAAIVFSAVTPIAAIIMKMLMNNGRGNIAFFRYADPIIAGAFVHIATTIFFESGTKVHEMNWKKWLSILLGGALVFVTELFHQI